MLAMVSSSNKLLTIHTSQVTRFPRGSFPSVGTGSNRDELFSNVGAYLQSHNVAKEERWNEQLEIARRKKISPFFMDPLFLMLKEMEYLGCLSGTPQAKCFQVCQTSWTPSLRFSSVHPHLSLWQFLLTESYGPCCCVSHQTRSPPLLVGKGCCSANCLLNYSEFMLCIQKNLLYVSIVDRG